MNVIHCIDRMKDKNPKIISQCRKSSLTNSMPLPDKNSQERVTEGTYLNIIKGLHDKPTANIILNSERLKAFLLRQRKRQGSPVSTPLFYILLQVLTRDIWPEREI